MLRCVKFKRTMLSNVLSAKAISRALLSSYLTRYIKNIYSVATTPLQFRNGVVYIFCVMYSLMIHFGTHKYEISLAIDIGLLHISCISITAKTT